ncbi:hypothetical protein [Pseudoduganella lurida]|nr:hypothetical protein [Pseudoduganella lurida]
MASMTLYANPPGALPLFAVRGANDLPLVFRVDGDGGLHLLRGTPGDAWSDTDLLAGLPGWRVCCADVRQAPGGGIAIALALRDGAGGSALRMATGVPADLDDAGWLALLASGDGMPALPGDGPIIRLAFGPLQAGAPTLLLITTAGGETGQSTWYCNAAAPLRSLRPMQLPAAVQGASAYAVGSYRLPGVWALQPGGRQDELRFMSFGDAFGWSVNIGYPNLPARTASVLLSSGSMPNVPDLFAAGDRIVVYRGGNNIPQLVARVAGARLLWTCANDGGEYLAYADAEGALWMVARPSNGAWHAPFLLTRRHAVLAAAQNCLFAISREADDRLVVRCFQADGTLVRGGLVETVAD